MSLPYDRIGWLTIFKSLSRIQRRGRFVIEPQSRSEKLYLKHKLLTLGVVFDGSIIPSVIFLL